nr:TIGR03668 family PPOX class F420-dependent oxidoreductase [Streptomyces mangrovisoli]
MPMMESDEARERFTGARVARLATVDGEGRPHVVPLVLAAVGHDTLGPDALGHHAFVSAVDRKPKTSLQLRRLHNIAVQPAVSLLVDTYDEDWDRLWWVRADGGARVVPADADDPALREEYAAALAALADKYPQYREQPPQGPVIAIAVHRWTGWRAASAPGPA